MKDDYSNRELDERFTSLQDSFEVRLDTQTETLGRIEKQTTKTNGRVTMLEKFMWSSIGVFPLIAGFTGWLAIDYLSHRDTVPKEQIQAAVNQAFDDNLNDKK